MIRQRSTNHKARSTNDMEGHLIIRITSAIVSNVKKNNNKCYWLIYSTKKIIFHNFRHKRAADEHRGSCGVDKYKNWMTSQSETANDEPVIDLRHLYQHNFFFKPRI